MLDQTTRLTILRLRSEGHGTRAIAHALGISRGAVKRVLVAGTDQVLPRALFETRFTGLDDPVGTRARRAEASKANAPPAVCRRGVARGARMGLSRD
ncbi:MAG: helix-turn-helix domain-containing protein, partial [Polyangiaceae bacterium]|jgi:IS30 family transposase